MNVTIDDSYEILDSQNDYSYGGDTSHSITVKFSEVDFNTLYQAAKTRFDKSNHQDNLITYSITDDTRNRIEFISINTLEKYVNYYYIDE
ncbi:MULTISPECIES: hypothetical protein [unclassified Myroides]|uniref:hypothetical protein n=1 Tax=unclassified Myroides TaxID=2642485 RepID=UPI003D2F5797